MSRVNKKNFDFHEILGTGGFGKVYRAVKNSGPDVNNEYAVKTIKKSSKTSLSDLQNEINVSRFVCCLCIH